MSIIEVNHVSKEFKLGQASNLKQTFVNGLKRLTGQTVNTRKPFKALDDVNFHVEQGEVFGIIGHNGAGKSTMLKLLSGISKPTSGNIKVDGHIAPLIEVGAGFVPDFTGRENVYLNGSIYGLKRKEIEKKFDEIVSFAEMEQFIDTPVKRYSSGMLVKLAFAVATSLDAEILIVDEVLAVGDLAFQRKCFDRVEDLILRQGRTVLLVSHNLRQVQRLCNRVILLDHGKINMEGSPKEVCDAFYKQNDEKIKFNIESSAVGSTTGSDLEIIDIYFRNAEGEISTQMGYDENCTIHFKIRTTKNLEDVTFGFGFHTTDFLFLSTCCSEEQIPVEYLPKGEYDVSCEIRKLQLLPGIYSIRFGVTATKACISVFYGENLKHFQVTGIVPITVRDGFFALDFNWGYKSIGA